MNHLLKGADNTLQLGQGISKTKTLKHQLNNDRIKSQLIYEKDGTKNIIFHCMYVVSYEFCDLL